jgi:hypothetical protein
MAVLVLWRLQVLEVLTAVILCLALLRHWAVVLAVLFMKQTQQLRLV